MKILVAVDGSPYTKRMLAYLAAHDEWLGPQHEYVVVNAVPPVPPRAAAVLDKAVLKAHYEEEAERVFKPLRTFFARHKLATTWISKAGAPADVICGAAAKGGFDLLMMGSHGHGTLGNLILGSVATKVLANSKVPVLIVR